MTSQPWKHNCVIDKEIFPDLDTKEKTVKKKIGVEETKSTRFLSE